MCKWMRNKYLKIDSHHIYECVRNIFRRKGICGDKKDTVMIWDKLGEIKPRQLKI